MNKLIDLIRSNSPTVRVNYDLPYNSECTDEELTSHIIYLDCSTNQLTSLPPLPQCQRLFCRNNQLTSLPPLPQCQILGCYNNQLTSLPPLPQCQTLYCSYNQLMT